MSNSINKIYSFIIDLIVPFGELLRNPNSKSKAFQIAALFWRYIPQTFFMYWLFSMIPFGGTLFYTLIMVPLSIHLHLKKQGGKDKNGVFKTVLHYFIVIVIGFGGIWNFIGHTVLADQVAADIGWATGSPFQTELAFYTLGSAIAGIMAVWLSSKEFFAAVAVPKAVFLYGAAIVHIRDVILYQNYSPLNVGTILVGDIVYPTIWIILLLKLFIKPEIR